MDYDFEPISFNNLKKEKESEKDKNNNKENYINYDLTTRETYRMKRILKKKVWKFVPGATPSINVLVTYIDTASYVAISAVRIINKICNAKLLFLIHNAFIYKCYCIVTNIFIQTLSLYV